MSDNIKILKNYLLYFLLMILVFMVGVSGVFADEIQNIGYITDYTDLTLINTSFGMTYDLPATEASNQNFTIQLIDLNFDYSFSANKTYLIEISTPLATLQNIDRISILSGSTRCSSLGIESDNINFPNIKFTCPSSVNSLTISLYNSNGNAITSNNTFRWNYTYLREIVPIIDFGPIINNQTQNTQDIINNNNANTDKEIESQQVCDYIDKNNISNDNKILFDSGAINDNNDYGITDFISINSNSKIKVTSTGSFPTVNNSALCFYNVNKGLISCIKNNSLSLNSELSIPSNSSYVRFTIRKNDNQPQFEICKNGNQALNDSITGLNDSLNDDDSSGATSEASEFFNSFTTNTFGLTSIITAPLNLIQSLTSSSCNELHLPLPYLNNKYLDLPCMTSIYQTHFGAFFTMYQTITYGIIAYWVCVRIFNQVKDFKNPEHDEIEVVDL